MSASLIASYGDDLAGFATAKGTLRFTPEHQLPVSIIERIVRDRMTQIDSR